MKPKSCSWFCYQATHKSLTAINIPWMTAPDVQQFEGQRDTLSDILLPIKVMGICASVTFNRCRSVVTYTFVKPKLGSAVGMFTLTMLIIFIF